jgi:hypothetical protein
MVSRISKHCKKEQCEKCEDVDCNCGCHGLFEDVISNEEEEEFDELEKGLENEPLFIGEENEED